ncbi:hypothetical protein QE449_003189 [Rhodococcus sp. SORGH_AS303]|nr:hypothetical protein [Rhodococcus sp. SORGH_AS_0303]
MDTNEDGCETAPASITVTYALRTVTLAETTA